MGETEPALKEHFAMRVLLVSKFLHHVGGVETYLDWLADTLIQNGHEVAVLGMEPPANRDYMKLGGAQKFICRNREFIDASITKRARSALNSIYSLNARTMMRQAVESFGPDVIHFHGVCYQLTSSVASVPVGPRVSRIATAHEYKFVCANQRLWSDRSTSVCTRCLSSTRLRRLVNPISERCIKGSLPASIVGGLEAVVSDRAFRSEQTDIRIHSPSQFMEKVLLTDGWEPSRISVIDLPWSEHDVTDQPNARLFLSLSRLALEKDLLTMLRGWQESGCGLSGFRLVVAGDGSEAPHLRRWAMDHAVENVDFVGRLTPHELGTYLSRSVSSVHPAAWYENSPLAVRESLMAGVPAIVSATGGMPELIREGSTGRCVEHSIQGWSGAFQQATQSPLKTGSALRREVDSYRTTEIEHLDRLLALYREK